jgi:uncharacterized protein
VSVAASLGFLLTLGSAGIDFGIVAMLLGGGLIAAPIAAWLVGKFDDQALATGVGGLIIFLNLDRGLGLFGIDKSLGLGLRLVVAAASIVVVVALLLRSRARRSLAASGSQAV